MNFGEDETLNEQIRAPRPLAWLQRYVDIFMTSCPQHCKELRLEVLPDPERRNGCNWQLWVHTPEGKADHEFHCLQYIEDDLRLLFSVFDMEMETQSRG